MLVGSGFVSGGSLGQEAAGRLAQGQRLTHTVSLGKAAAAANDSNIANEVSGRLALGYDNRYLRVEMRAGPQARPCGTSNNATFLVRRG